MKLKLKLLSAMFALVFSAASFASSDLCIMVVNNSNVQINVNSVPSPGMPVTIDAGKLSVISGDYMQVCVNKKCALTITQVPNPNQSLLDKFDQGDVVVYHTDNTYTQYPAGVKCPS